MTHYVAIVEEEEGKAVGVWFPDLPGCISAGDSLDEAMTNAAEALALPAEQGACELEHAHAEVSGQLLGETEVEQHEARPLGLDQQVAGVRVGVEEAAREDLLAEDLEQ